MSYATHIKDHLARYKENTLGLEEWGKWRGIEYPHILPSNKKDLNILEGIRDELFSYLESQQELKLHSDFAHLNSSQAACFNLFFPILTRGSWTMPKDLLPLNFSLISNWKFEYIASSSEGTNFDLWVQNEDGHELFIEFKLTENEFGTAKSDARHLKKLNEIYEPKLRNKIAPEFLEPKEFFQHYQLLRNVSYSDSEIPASVIFLVPRENRSLAPSLSRIMAALTPETRSMVSICYLEDLVEALRFDGSNSDMSSYFTEYANKYLPEIHLNESR